MKATLAVFALFLAGLCLLPSPAYEPLIPVAPKELSCTKLTVIGANGAQAVLGSQQGADIYLYLTYGKARNGANVACIVHPDGETYFQLVDSKGKTAMISVADILKGQGAALRGDLPAFVPK